MHQGTSDKRTPGADRDLVVGQGPQRGVNRTREGRHRLARVNPWSSQYGSKAQTSGGGRQVGALSRWTVAPCPGDMGGEKQVQR